MLVYFSNRQTNICLKLFPNCKPVLYVPCIPSVRAVCVCVRVCACARARARVCKPIFVLSVGHELKALVYSRAVYGVNRRPLDCWDRGFTFH